MKINRWFATLFLTVLAFLLQTGVYGQKLVDAAYSPLSSPFVPNGDLLELIMDKKITPTDITMVVLLDSVTGQSFQVARPYTVVGNAIEVRNALQPFNLNSPPVTLQQLFIANPKFLNAHPIVATVLSKVDPKTGLPTATSARLNSRIITVEPAELDSVVSKGRDDAEIYIQGSSVTAVDSKPVFATDIKYEKPVPSLKIADKVNVIPYLSYKGSTNPKADPDQLRVGFKFSGFVFNSSDDSKKTCIFCYLAWNAGEEFESNRHFTVKNLITTSRFNLGSRPFLIKKGDKPKNSTIMKFIPFIGFEVGKNLRSPIPRQESAIARILFGASLNFAIPPSIFKKIGINQGIRWENSFTQRTFLKPEYAYDKDKDGKLKLVSFGKQPHPYLVSKLSFLFNDFFGPTITYEWGEIPPLYNRMKHKVEIGFTFSMKSDTPK